MKKVMIYGAGVSGQGALKLLEKEGYEVLLVDDKIGIKSDEALKLLEDIEFFVKSPGIPYNKLVMEVIGRGIEVIDEIELAYRYDRSGAKIIAVTGTNGKTTTTSKIAGLIKEAGFRVEAGGNIGKSYSEIIIENTALDYIVLELSSYQLENIKTFRPYIGMIINLSPDHLDRYDSLEAYYRAKANIIDKQNEEDYFIYNSDSKEIEELSLEFKASLVKISSRGMKNVDYYVEDGGIGRGGKKLLEVDRLSLKGKHNLENIMFILAVGDILKIDRELIKSYLYSTAPLEHRMEIVLEKDGVIFVNDSKGTNIDSTIKAIEAYKESPILICGGKDKAVDLNPLADCIVQRVKTLYLMGQTGDMIEELVRKRGYNSVYNFGTLEKIIENIVLEKDDIVLFSPAHSSFDQFKNYIERGLEFKRLVRLKFGK